MHTVRKLHISDKTINEILTCLVVDSVSPIEVDIFEPVLNLDL